MKDKYESTGSSLEGEIRSIVKDAIHEAHEEGVHGASSNDSSGRSMLPLMLVAGALLAAAYLMRSNSGSMGQTVEQMSDRVQEAAEGTAERTEEMSDQAADRMEERGEMMSDQTEQMSQQAADRVQEGGTGVASRIETGGEEAADKMDENMDSDDESDTSGSL